jgi:hypothetical protein
VGLGLKAGLPPEADQQRANGSGEIALEDDADDALGRPDAVTAALSRLEDYRSRILAAAEQVLCLWEVWTTFNEAKELRQIIKRSPASLAAAVYEEASLNNLVMVVVRLLDHPKPDRITFFMVQQQLRIPGVSEALIADAPSSIHNLFAKDVITSGQASTKITARITEFHARLERLAAEQPNRTELLRKHRHANLAHELLPDKVRVKPTYDQIKTMVFEILALAENVHAIVTGSSLQELLTRGEASESALELWQAVAMAFPVEK